jgi:hypothetical protein
MEPQRGSLVLALADAAALGSAAAALSSAAAALGRAAAALDRMTTMALNAAAPTFGVFGGLEITNFDI